MRVPELNQFHALIVETAKSSGRPTVAHAATDEGMRRAILAGVEMIEHGDGASSETFQLMKSKHVALCPTLAAGYSILTYGGWDHHANVTGAMRGQMPAFDQAFARLIRDLDERGLLDTTMVVVSSEFGRTPKVNSQGGRDH